MIIPLGRLVGMVMVAVGVLLMLAGLAHANPPRAWVALSGVSQRGDAVSFTLTRSRGWLFAGYPRGCRITISYMSATVARTFPEVFWPASRTTRVTMGLPPGVVQITSVSASCRLRHFTRRHRWLSVTRTATAP